MSNIALSDYFCGDEEIRFTHFRIPRQLITHPRFKTLSADAKLLYGMLLNRMSLSAKYGWHDSVGRVYIYYTVKEVCAVIGCGREDAIAAAVRPWGRSAPSVDPAGEARRCVLFIIAEKT